MKFFTVFAPWLLLFLLIGCSPASNKSSKTRALFNGKDLDGWEIQSNGQFFVADGMLKNNKSAGWLRSKDTFSDFLLTIEFRFLEKGANGGIFVRTGPTSKDDEKGYPDNGYQVQCIDLIEHQYPLAHLIPYGAPEFESKSDIEALKRVFKPTGEWNTFEITCKGEAMEIKLNGTVITTATSIKNLSGHIGIQGEDPFLDFRKITVELL